MIVRENVLAVNFDALVDVLVKSRLTGENRCPEFMKHLKSLDSGLRRNDDNI